MAVVRELGAPVLPSFPADDWVCGAVEPVARAGLTGDLTRGRVDALVADGFEASWAGVAPRVDRVVVLGFNETRLGLCARALARSLATSRADGLGFVLVAGLAVEGAAVVFGLLATLRAGPSEEGFFFAVAESELCERVSDLSDFDPVETFVSVFSRDGSALGSVSVFVAVVVLRVWSGSPLISLSCSGRPSAII